MTINLMSAAEAATACGVTSQTIHRWVDEGQLEGMRIGKDRLILHTEEVERFKKERASA